MNHIATGYRRRPTALDRSHRLRQLCVSLLLVLGAAGVNTFTPMFMSRALAEPQYTRSPGKSQWVTVTAKPEVPSIFAPDDEIRLIGATLLVGVPDGIAPGVSFHPWTNLVHIDLSLSGLLSMGFRAGVTLDPFDWVVAPTLTVAAGYNGWADLPFTTGKSLRFQTTYLNVQPGIEVGRRSRFRIFLRAGYSHLWVNTDYWPSYSGRQATSSTKAQLDLLPTFNLGITGYL